MLEVGSEEAARSGAAGDSGRDLVGYGRPELLPDLTVYSLEQSEGCFYRAHLVLEMLDRFWRVFEPLQIIQKKSYAVQGRYGDADDSGSDAKRISHV
jgi:hypothetical protein